MKSINKIDYFKRHSKFTLKYTLIEFSVVWKEISIFGFHLFKKILKISFHNNKNRFHYQNNYLIGVFSKENIKILN